MLIIGSHIWQASFLVTYLAIQKGKKKELKKTRDFCLLTITHETVC
jgi:hypothetical protein